MDEKTRHELIGELIEAIKEKNRPHSNLDHLYVHFFDGKKLITDDLSVDQAFDCLWNDVFLFEDFDLRNATRLELHVH